MDTVEIATPYIPETERWSNIERLNRERDLVGIYLSAHPLDDYKVILNHMCNTHCQELEDKAALMTKGEIRMGGIVTDVKAKYTKKGNPCGFVTIEDFEGSGEIALFDKDWADWQSMLNVGCTVYITARCQKKYETSTFVDFHISDIQFLSTVKEQRIDRITITMNADTVDEGMVTDLSTLIRSHPGKTDLFIQVYAGVEHQHVMLRSKSVQVDPHQSLLDYLEQQENMSYHIN